MARCIVAWLLVAFWLPASSHVHLQQFGLIHELHEDHPDHQDHDDGSPGSGHHEHGADNHAAADGECLLSSGTAGSDLSWDRLNEFGFGFVPALSDSLLLAAPEATGLAPPGTGPPGFSASWQFLLRAALPVRAPSSVS